jgi:hypothetical protein
MFQGKSLLLSGLIALTTLSHEVFASCEDHYKERLRVDRRMKAIAQGLGTTGAVGGFLMLNPVVGGVGVAVSLGSAINFKEYPLPLEKLLLIVASQEPNEMSLIQGDTGISIMDGPSIKYSYHLTPEIKDLSLTNYLSVVKKDWIKEETCPGISSTKLGLDVLREAITKLNASEAFCPEKKHSLKKIKPSVSVSRKKMLKLISMEACSQLKGSPQDLNVAYANEKSEHQEEIAAEIRLQESQSPSDAQVDGERHFLEKQPVGPVEVEQKKIKSVKQ